MTAAYKIHEHTYDMVVVGAALYDRAPGAEGCRLLAARRSAPAMGGD